MRCTRTFPFRLIALAVFAAMLGGVPAELVAEPQAPTEEQSADTTLATSFVGKSYDDELDIDGWTDLGGGLVVAPIFVHEYQRDDGTFLVLTSRQVSKETSTAPASFQVVDSLIVHPPQAGVEFSIACMQGQDETLRIHGRGQGRGGARMVDRRAACLGDLAGHRQDRRRQDQWHPLHQHLVGAVAARAASLRRAGDPIG